MGNDMGLGCFVLIFAVVQLCTAEYVEEVQKMISKDNLSLILNRCHHPLITQVNLNQEPDFARCISTCPPNFQKFLRL
jgi:hypothetical protein